MATDLQYREGLTDTQKNQLVTRLDRIKAGSAITDTDKANFNYGLGTSWESYLGQNLNYDGLGKTPTPATPTPQPDPTQAFMNGLAGANTQNQAQLTEQQQRLQESQKLMKDAQMLQGTNPDQTAYDQRITQLEEAYKGTMGKGEAYKQQLEQAGVPEAQKRLANLNILMAQQQASFNQGMLDTEGKVIPMRFITGQQAQMQKQYAVTAGNTAMMAQALQGNITMAKQTAMDTVNLEYADREAELNMQKQMLELNYDKLTRSEKRRADELNFMLDQETKRLEEEKAEKLAITDLMIKAAENGADPATIKRIQNSKTEAEAVYNAGGSLAKFAEDKVLSPSEASMLGVPYGTTERQAAAMGVVPKSVLNPTDKIKTEMDLMTKVDANLKESKTAQRQIGIMETGYNAAVQAGLDGNSLNAPSQAVLVTFQKLLDPTSVVRESEYARSGDGQSLIQRIQGEYQKIQAGGAGVTQKGLQEFYNMSQQLLKGYESSQLDTLKRTRIQADNWGLNLNNVITPEAQQLLAADDKKRLDDYARTLKTTNEKNVLNQIIRDVYDAGGGDYDVLKVLGQGFNTVGGDTKLATTVASVPDGSSGGQCGRFVNKYTNLGLGDSYESKMSKMDPSIKIPAPGMVFVTPYSWTGHTGFIIDVNMRTGMATVKDSNSNLDEKVRTRQIPISKITGLARV